MILDVIGFDFFFYLAADTSYQDALSSGVVDADIIGQDAIPNWIAGYLAAANQPSGTLPRRDYVSDDGVKKLPSDCSKIIISKPVLESFT